jgi:hypothetical protein
VTIQLSRRTVVIALAAFLAFAGMATASFVLTLTRNADAGVFPGGFSDTPPWIADQATWLANQGIASGFEDGTFRPGDNITRGQAAFWLANYNDSIEIVQAEVIPGQHNIFARGVTCPVGKRVIGGGGEASDVDIFLTRSYPDSATSWRVRFETANQEGLSPSYIRAYAVCAPDTIP